jgi:hypothetical protein
MAEFIHKSKGLLKKLSKQDFINFVGAHPRLMTLVAGLGITVAFGWMGKFFIHEALATSAAASLSSSPVTMTHVDFQIDYIDKTPVSNLDIYKTALPTHCHLCAAPFAPGHEAISPGDAKDFAPGELAKSPGDAKDFAPGHVFKKEIT